MTTPNEFIGKITLPLRNWIHETMPGVPLKHFNEIYRLRFEAVNLACLRSLHARGDLDDGYDRITLERSGLSVTKTKGLIKELSSLNVWLKGFTNFVNVMHRSSQNGGHLSRLRYAVLPDGHSRAIKRLYVGERRSRACCCCPKQSPAGVVPYRGCLDDPSLSCRSLRPKRVTKLSYASAG
jgi:hypothetical protein